MYLHIKIYTFYYAALISERGLSLIEGVDMFTHIYPKVTYYTHVDIIGSSFLFSVWSYMISI